MYSPTGRTGSKLVDLISLSLYQEGTAAHDQVHNVACLLILARRVEEYPSKFGLNRGRPRQSFSATSVLFALARNRRLMVHFHAYRAGCDRSDLANDNGMATSPMS